MLPPKYSHKYVVSRTFYFFIFYPKVKEKKKGSRKNSINDFVSSCLWLSHIAKQWIDGWLTWAAVTGMKRPSSYTARNAKPGGRAQGYRSSAVAFIILSNFTQQRMLCFRVLNVPLCRNKWISLSEGGRQSGWAAESFPWEDKMVWKQTSFPSCIMMASVTAHY